MLIYWFIYFFICISVLFCNVKSIYSKLIFIFTMLFMVFFIGFRYEVGADWKNYLVIYDYFKYIDFKEALFISDIAYSILNYISQSLGFEDTIFVNVICGLLVCIFIYITFLKLKEYWVLLLILFPYHILVVSLNYTRQSVALAILMYAFTFLIEKRILKYIVFILFAALFHKTAILFLLFVPLFFMVKRYYLYLYEILSIGMISVMLYLSSLSEQNMYISSDSDISSAGVFMRLSIHVIPVYLYLFFRNKFYLHFNQQIINILDYMLLLILFCCILALPFSTLSDRFNLYLIFFDLFVVSFIFYQAKLSTRLAITLSLITYFTMFIYVWIFYGEWASKAWIPYKNYVTNYLFERVF